MPGSPAGRGPVPVNRTGGRRRVRPRRPSAVTVGILAVALTTGCGAGTGTGNANSNGTGNGAATGGPTERPRTGDGDPASGPHVRFRDSGVDVEAWLSTATGPAAIGQGSSGQGSSDPGPAASRVTLSVLLTPDKDYHLYSLDLPETGISGLGRPTRVRLVSGLTALGGPVADRPVVQLDLPDLDVVLPVYPAGPVMLTVPVQVAPGGRRTVAVSYAACSATRCQTPVTDHPLELPAS